MPIACIAADQMQLRPSVVQLSSHFPPQGMILGPLPYTDYSLEFKMNMTAADLGIVGASVMSFNYSSEDVDLCVPTDPTNNQTHPMSPSSHPACL